MAYSLIRLVRVQLQKYLMVSTTQFGGATLFFVLALMLSGCATSASQTPTRGMGEKEPEIDSDAIILPETQLELLASTQFSVVWIPEGDELNIRQPAGLTGTIVGTIPSHAKDVRLTGKRTLLGSSLWVEVLDGEEGIGWVNAWNLTEIVSPEAFCEDQKVIDLLNHFRRFIEGDETYQFSTFTSEVRGLNFRLNWYSPEIHFNKDGIDDLQSNLNEYDWGILADSGLAVNGTFPDVIYPKLEEVISGTPEYTCNHIQSGTTNGEVIWPEELSNLNYYGVYLPPENGNSFAWRSWAIGIEYVFGEPFIAVLIHYSSEL